jgi:hypothetical protein
MAKGRDGDGGAEKLSEHHGRGLAAMGKGGDGDELRMEEQRRRR